MEKMTYEEARGWFWTRTWFWAAPAALATAVSYFLFAAEMYKSAEPRTLIAAGIGIGSVLLGVLAAWLSMQSPWMRGGWKIGIIINGILCIGIAGVISGFISAFVMAYIERDPALYPVSEALRESTMMSMGFGIGASALWGFVFGSWFAMRRDRYFVERL